MSAEVEFKSLQEFNALHHSTRARQIEALLAGLVGLRYEGRDLLVSGPVRGNRLEAGMIVIAVRGHASHFDFYEIRGLSDAKHQYGASGVVFHTVKEALYAAGVGGLASLERAEQKNDYGYSTHLIVRDLENITSGPWGYLFYGRWCVGSGADPLSFYLLKPAVEVYRQREIAKAEAELRAFRICCTAAEDEIAALTQKLALWHESIKHKEHELALLKSAEEEDNDRA